MLLDSMLYMNSFAKMSFCVVMPSTWMENTFLHFFICECEKGGMARMCVTQEFGGRGLGIGGNNSFSILNITGLV